MNVIFKVLVSQDAVRRFEGDRLYESEITAVLLTCHGIESALAEGNFSYEGCSLALCDTKLYLVVSDLDSLLFVSYSYLFALQYVRRDEYESIVCVYGAQRPYVLGLRALAFRVCE